MGRISAAHKYRLSSRGFTLVEMAAVIAVCALLLSATVPHIATISTRSALNTEALGLRLFLERAYAYALASRTQVTIECAPRQLTARLSQGDIVATHKVGHGAELKSKSLSDGKLLLHPSIATSPASLELTKGARSCLVIMSLRGRIRISC
jgi:prepilin-type N-terminal cleavage/methylation domain-containing protein